jgi:hypothetical protein
MICSKSEFAHRVGVSPAAVSIALKAGRIAQTPEGKIDLDVQANADYLTTVKRQRRQGKRGSGQPPAAPGESGGVVASPGQPEKDGPKAPAPPAPKKRRVSTVAGGAGPDESAIDGETYTMAELRKMIADADLKEQKLAQDRGELVRRVDIKLVFARTYSVHSSQLKTMASKLGPDIAAAFSLTEADTPKVQELMELEIQRALSQIKKELYDYLDTVEAEPDDDN